MVQVTLAKNQIRADRWRMLVQTCQQSGQTVVNWCEENNINVKTYYYWLRKLRKQELCTKELPVPIPEEFLPASVDGVVIRSSTEGSAKKFKLTVDDSGKITATELT